MLCRNAERPVIITGGGASFGRMPLSELQEFVEKHKSHFTQRLMTW
ncbi:MAG: hypothetical protein CM15mP14_4160 [Rhodospirillaceae bacterium]|nr:MAG: hypothetical protein CM15mP14_4160 [Rhodospirillaceae bacterium]